MRVGLNFRRIGGMGHSFEGDFPKGRALFIVSTKNIWVA